MGKKWHSVEEIVAKLRQVIVLTAQGRMVAEAIRKIGMTGVTSYRWRSECGRYGYRWIVVLLRVADRQSLLANDVDRVPGT
jgi:hypothetical protein